MNLLLDTHTFIWFINGDAALPNNVKAQIADVNNKCLLSIASIWEIAIKLSLQKLQLNSDFNKVADFLYANDIEILPVKFPHLQTLLSLPSFHKDPFDRIIIAQAITENLIIATKDGNFSSYDVQIIWN